MDKNKKNNSYTFINHLKINFRHNTLIRFIKILLLTGLLIFVSTILFKQISRIEWNQLIFDVHFLFLSIMVAIFVRIFIGLFYAVFLKLLGNNIPYHISMAVSWVVMLGKYIPGKIAIFANAITLLAQYKVRASIATIVPLLSNCMSVLIALIISLPLLFSPWVKGMIPFSKIWFIICITIGLLMIWPRIFLGTSNFLLYLFKKESIHVSLNFKQMFVPVCVVFCQCIFWGLTTWCLARTLSPTIGLDMIPVMISVSALAGSLGVLAFFAPAGLGVIEGVYLLILGPIIGIELSALLAVCLRLLQTAIDLLMALLGGLIIYFSSYKQFNKKK